MEKKNKDTKLGLKAFKITNKQFVLMRGEKIDLKIVKPSQQELLALLRSMPIDERIQFYMDNFESIFVSLFPEDVGYFIFAPENETEWDQVDENLTRLGSS